MNRPEIDPGFGIHPSPIALEVEPPPAATLSWVPVRSLTERHRGGMLALLMRLSGHDRYLRFGYAASDAQLAVYVEQLNFQRDELLAIFDRRLNLLAMAHLAVVADAGDPASQQAEFGVCVAEHARGRGYGSLLFEHAVLHARNRGVQSLMIHALSENQVMLRIAKRAGAEVVHAGAQAQAWLRLPPDSLVSQVEQIVAVSAGELDYCFKQHWRRDAVLRNDPRRARETSA